MKECSKSFDQIGISSDSNAVKKIKISIQKLKKNINLESESKLKTKNFNKKKLVQELIITYKQKDSPRNINPSLEKIILNSDGQNKYSCNVCLSSIQYFNNKIVQCSICLDYVHQSCYGSKLKELIYNEENMKEWNCNRCVFIMKTNFKEEEFNSFFNKISCLFCPKYTGMTKKITEFFWAHICCVNWIQEVNFEDSNNENVDLKRIKWQERKCYICKLTVGHSIKCYYGTCNKYFHVTCAITIGSIYNSDLMRSNNCLSSNEDKSKVFCANHNLEYLENITFSSSKAEDSKCILDNEVSYSLLNIFPKNVSKKKYTINKRMPVKNLEEIKDLNNFIPKSYKEEEESCKNAANKNIVKMEICDKIEEFKDISSNYVDLIEEEFQHNEKKFYNFINKDMKRVKEKGESLLTITSFTKITKFINKYVESRKIE